MDQLGIQLPVIVAQIVNFTILALLLHKFLYKPVLRMLDDRRKKVEDQLKQAQELNSKEASWFDTEKELLKKAKEEANSIIASAKKQAKAESEAILAKAKEEAQKEKQKMEKELLNQHEASQTKLKQQTLDIASQMVQKAFEELPAALQKELINQSLSNLKKIHGSA